MSQADRSNQSNAKNPRQTADVAVNVTAQPLVRQRRRRGSRRSPFNKFLKRVNKALPWRLVVISLISGVVIYGVITAVIVSRAITNVNESLDSVRRVIVTVSSDPGGLSADDFDRLRISTRDLVNALSSARSQTGVLRVISRVNPDISVTLDALTATEQIATSGLFMLNGVQPAINFALGGEEQDLSRQISSGERIVELLTVGLSQFQVAENRLETAGELLNALPRSGISNELLQNISQIRLYHEQLTTLNNLLLQAPTLLTTALGLDEERSYLVMSANSDEIRPSGGYVSTYGWIRVGNGRVLDYAYSPTGTANPNPPSMDLLSQIQPPEWWLPFNLPGRTAWDGSWTPNFPETAERAVWYYNNGRNPQSPLDGVISIDMVGFDYILEGIGAVIVPGYNITVTPENFRELVYGFRASQGEEPHKRFVSAIYQAIFAEWQTGNLDPEVSSALLSSTIRALAEKHLMLYFNEPELNEAMDSLGWSGRQDTGTGYDYLMLVDSNLGNKSSRSVVRQVTYDVRLNEDGTANSRTTLNYDFPAALASEDPAVNPEYNGQLDYFTLSQLYLPLGAQISDTRTGIAGMQTAEYNGHTLLSGFLSIPYNTAQRYQFQYTTPQVIEQEGTLNRYRLLIEKQPGTIGDAVTVTVGLPNGARVAYTNPAPNATYSLDTTILEFQLELTTDTWIEIMYNVRDRDDTDS